MTRRWIAVVGVLVVALATASAVAVNAQRDDDPFDHMPGMMAGARDDSPRQRAHWSWMRGWSTDNERDYLTEMVAHHEEAVAAARELERSDRQEMRLFGTSIVETQSAQIDQMNGWLNTWYPGRQSTDAYRPMMRDLGGLSGDRLDRVFLEDMIAHHMMAVMMSQQFLARGLARHDQVAELAEAIRNEQHEEIFQMRQWLADWFGTGWRPMSGPTGCWSGDGRMGPGMMW